MEPQKKQMKRPSIREVLDYMAGNAKASAGIALDIGKEAVKAPVRAAASVVDAGKILAGGEPSEAFNLGPLGEIKTYEKDAQELSQKYGPVWGILKPGVQAVLEVYGAGKLTEKALSAMGSQSGEKFLHTAEQVLHNQSGTGLDMDYWNKAMPPEMAKGRIDDVAQKLDLFDEGLGETFRKAVDPSNATVQQVRSVGLKVLREAAKGMPDLSPIIAGATLGAEEIGANMKSIFDRFNKKEDENK